MFHGVELARAIMLNQTPAIAWWASVLYLLAWIVGFGVLSIAPLRRKLKP
jgi:hypothetical protein